MDGPLLATRWRRAGVGFRQMITLEGLEGVNLRQGDRIPGILQGLLHRDHVHVRQGAQVLHEPEQQINAGI